MSKIFNLSVVNIVPDAHRVNVDLIAEMYGCGHPNLSVKLQGDDVIYWGCHSKWNPDDYATFSDEDLRNDLIHPDLRPSLEFLYERIVLDGDAQENWQAVLSELGLSIIETEEI